MNSLFKGKYVSVDLIDETPRCREGTLELPARWRVTVAHYFYSVSESIALEKELSEANKIINRTNAWNV